MGTQIMNGIWLGDVNDVMNIKLCMNKNIKSVIYCSNDENDYEYFNRYNIEFIKIPISQYEKKYYTKHNDEFFDYMTDIIKYMYEKYVNFKNILLACQEGSQISPALICAFLIKYGHMNVENAIESVKTKGGKFFYGDCHYVHALNKFYYRLHNQ
jgi:protein-tyrosine phosphatase